MKENARKPLTTHYRLFLAVCPLLLATPVAHGQIFQGGDPGDSNLFPLVGPEGASGHAFLDACTGGPGLLLIVARGTSLIAMGEGYLPGLPHSWPVASGKALEDVAGVPISRIVSLAASPARDRVFVGLVPGAGVEAAPILAVDWLGNVEVAVAPWELASITGQGTETRGLAMASDGMLTAVLWGLEEHALVHIDLKKTAGNRVTVVAFHDDLAAALPGITGNTLANWGTPLAVDAAGRAYLVAWLDIGEFHYAPHCVVLQVGSDGKATELTRREEPFPTYPEWNADLRVLEYPCQGVTHGLAFDEDLGLLVGSGAGVWLLDPKHPGRYRNLLDPLELEGLANAFKGKDIQFYPPGPASPGACLGRFGPEGTSAYGSLWRILYGFVIQPGGLDFDRDLLSHAEEKARGTDPLVMDSDGGGCGDGAELMDFTDPLKPDDDRPTLPHLPASMSAAYYGSAFGKSFLGSPLRWSALDLDGSVLFSAWGAKAGKVGLYRFTGWDRSAELLDREGCDSEFVVTAKGDLLCVHAEGVQGPALVPRDGGSPVPLLPPSTLQSLVGGSYPSAVAARPDGVLFVGFGNGRLIRVAPDGTASLVYDGQADLVAAGQADENGMCYGGACTCKAAIGSIAYDPVRSVTYLWVENNLTCSQGSGVSPVLVALRPDGSFRRIAEQDLLWDAMLAHGGQVIKDMEPDMAGGFWILSATGIERALTHVDSSFTPRAIQVFELPSGVTGSGGEGHIASWSLAHADDLTMTRDGRLFTVPAQYFNQYPQSYFPAEIVPVEPRVRPGDLLTVLPGVGALGKALPQGGGIVLFRAPGADAETEGFRWTPVSVAAMDGAVAVGDALGNAVVWFAIAPDGTLGSPKRLGKVASPGGMDFDASGRVVVVDRTTATLFRISADGTQETVATEADLGEPVDVVALEKDALLVADARGRLLRVAPNGELTPLGTVASVSSVAVQDGQAFLVAPARAGLLPVRIANGVETTLGQNAGWLTPDRVAGPGGIAADTDGNAYWLPWVGGAPDIAGSPALNQILRMTPQGSASVLIRSGLGASNQPGDICRVRRATDPLPALPGEKPTPPETGPEPSTGDDAWADAPADPAPDGLCRIAGTDGGCGMTAAGDAGTAVLFLAAVLVLARTGRRRSFLLSLLCLGCGGGGGSSGICDIGTGDAVAPDLWMPADVPAVCIGKNLCPPGTEAVCASDTALRGCLPDADGCWVWTASRQCPLGQTCSSGRCKVCKPTCDLFRCGDDGCGGSCGTCAAPDTCCHGFCAPCKPDCSGRACGDDGSGGSCGSCAPGQVCDRGTCRPETSGSCFDYYACNAACVPWDPGCRADCGRLPNGEAAWQATNLNSCTLLRCAACFQFTDTSEAEACLDRCTLKHCAEPFAYCFASGHEEICAASADCLAGCLGKDGNCAIACAGKATPEAFIPAVGLEACLQTACGAKSGSGVDACRKAAKDAACAKEAAACP